MGVDIISGRKDATITIADNDGVYALTSIIIKLSKLVKLVWLILYFKNNKLKI